MYKFSRVTRHFQCPKCEFFSKERKAISHFRCDDNGSLTIFSLFLLIMMLMITGLAVDLMRSETHRTRLQSTLDRAVLAGASLEQTLNSEDVVRDYFKKANLDQYLTSVVVDESGTAKTVSASAVMTAETYFMSLLGINDLSAVAAGQAEESLSDVEISLVLDVSGSMSSTSASGQSKMEDLIDAANEFVYLMQCDPDAEQPYDDVCVVEDNSVSISLIPYAEQVLVGEELLQQFNITNEHTQSSCVDFVASDFNSSSLSLTDQLQRGGTLDRRTNHSSWGGHGSNTRFARDLNTNSSRGRTCRTHSYRQIVPYSNSYTDLQSDINDLESRGYTSIHLGMKWATTLLDPAFRPALTNLTTGATPMINPAFDGRPFDYGRPRTQKVVVLMTDGKNTSLYSLKPGFRSGPSPFWLNTAENDDDDELSVYRESTGKYFWVKDEAWHDDPYGNENGGSDAQQMTYPELWDKYNVDYWDDEFSWLPDSWDYTGSSTMNGYLDDICDTAKAQGIEVFTLGFETSSSSSAVMSNCASSASHHFDVDGTNISAAFNSIAREIHVLRLTN